MKEPLLDPFATERAGVPRELLADLTSGARVPKPAHLLDPDAWAMLRDGRRRGLYAGRTASGRALHGSGLLTAIGTPTALGQQLIDCSRDATGVVTVTREGAGVVELWTCRQHGDLAVLDVRAAADEPALDAAPHALDLLHASVAVARILDRLGLGPLWTFEDEESAPVEEAAITERILDGAAPVPPGAGPLLERAWKDGPWREVVVRRQPDGPELRVLQAGATAWLEPVPAGDGAVRLVPLPPSALLPRLLGLLLPPLDA